MKVFVTHAEGDEPLARQVLRALEQAGLEVWDDEREIYPSDNWAKVTGQALEEAEALVVLLTPKALDSTRVLRDIDFALVNGRFKNRVIPVLVGLDQSIAMERVPWILRHLKVVTMPAVGRQEEDIECITHALKAVA